MKKGKWILKRILAGIVFLFAVGVVTMLLWNWLVPALFHGPEIRFIEALGLLLLSKILFSGWRGGRCGPGTGGMPPWKQRYYEKWSSMTPEERERFKSRMREKWCVPPGPEKRDNPGETNV